MLIFVIHKLLDDNSNFSNNTFFNPKGFDLNFNVINNYLLFGLQLWFSERVIFIVNNYSFIY